MILIEVISTNTCNTASCASEASLEQCIAKPTPSFLTSARKFVLKNEDNCSLWITIMKPALCTIFMKVAIKHNYHYNNDLHATFHPNVQRVLRIQHKQLWKPRSVVAFYPAAFLKYIVIKYQIKKKTIHPSAKCSKCLFWCSKNIMHDLSQKAWIFNWHKEHDIMVRCDMLVIVSYSSTDVLSFPFTEKST